MSGRSRSRSPRRSSPPESRRDRSKSTSKDRQKQQQQRRENSPPPVGGGETSEIAQPTAILRDKSRSRSRSPPRGPKKSSNARGFKWKSGRDRDVEDGRDRDGRDFRDRDRERDRAFQPRRYGGGRDERERERDRDRDRDRGGNGRRDGGWDSKVNDKFGNGTDRDRRKDSDRRDARSGHGKESTGERSDKPPPRVAAAAAAAASQTYIIVTVNDRLGTKANIPCLASDSVGDFKKIVAAHIGRKPHEIMLKRQGERPFKDMLSLEDYGVSSGVQLDLELDTGD